MYNYNLALITGVDIAISDLQLVIHQPSILEISYVGEQDFLNAVRYLCLDKNELIEDKTLLQNLSNFQVLMKVLEQSENKEKKNMIKKAFSLFFPTLNMGMTPNSIFLIDSSTGQQVANIDSNNFNIFQELIGQICCVNSLFHKDQVVYNPAGKRAQEIANKIYKGRKKKEKMQENKSSKQSLFSSYVSILTVGLNSMSLSDCLNLTIYQIFDLIDRYSLYLNWDIDLRARLAGATPKSETENWMKDIHS